MGLFDWLFRKPPPPPPAPPAPPDDGFTARFNQALAAVNAHIPAARYEDAAVAMLDFIEATKHLQGKDIDTKRASAYGLAGIYFLNTGKAAESVDPLQKSANYCMALQDKQATSAYLQQLYNAHRYLGNVEAAAGYADRVAEVLAGTPDEDSWKYRANLVRNREPLLRILVVQDKRTFELPEVAAIKGSVNFAYERNRPMLDVSRHWVAQGDKLCVEGQYAGALDHYRRAAGVDPFDPDPHYKSAMALLLEQRYAEAIEQYEAAIALAPGWFTADSELWIARELAAGRFTHEAFLVLWAVEYSQIDEAERLRLIDQVLPQFPWMPHLHFYRGTSLAALNRPAEALEAFNSGLAQNPEPDIRSRLLSQRAIYTPPAEQRPLFQEILDLPHANLLSRATAEIMIYRTPE